MTAMLSRAGLLVSVLLLCSGTFAYTHASLGGVEGTVGSSPFLAQTTVNLTKSGSGGSSPLTLASTPAQAESCEGVSQTVTGSGVLSGSFEGGFSLTGVNVTTTLHCGVRGDGEPQLDVVTTPEYVTGPLSLDIGSGEIKELSSYSITASVYDDVKNGGHYIAGHLRGEQGGDDFYWFDTCAESFEVRALLG